MATWGKKLSSAVAVACVWVGGSAILQLAYLGLIFALVKLGHVEGTKAAAMWFAVPSPLLVASGGTAAVWILRKSSGWPKLALPRLFLRGLCLSVFALVLLPLAEVVTVALLASVLGVAGAMSLAWQEAHHGSLGTHLFAASTRVPPGAPDEQDNQKRTHTE